MIDTENTIKIRVDELGMLLFRQLGFVVLWYRSPVISIVDGQDGFFMPIWAVRYTKRSWWRRWFRREFTICGELEQKALGYAGFTLNSCSPQFDKAFEAVAQKLTEICGCAVEVIYDRRPDGIIHTL